MPRIVEETWLHDAWHGHRATLLRVAIVLMAVAAAVWLGYEFGRLLFDLGPNGAVDLSLRLEEVQAWFKGEPVYSGIGPAPYPPASYVILWPVVGWLGIEQARWFYALTTLGALAWLVSLLVRASGANSRTERIFIGLIPLSVYATGATIGNGQLILYILPPLITGLLLLGRPAGFRNDLLGAFLVTVSLVKPSVSAPFLWIVLFAPGRLRPALFTVSGYVGLTALALSFQEGGLLQILDAFRQTTSGVLGQELAMQSQTNVHRWLSSLGLGEWIPAASLTLFFGMGVWTCLQRRRSLWLVMGVAALVARLWTYHAWYDDLLVVVPMIALFRIAKFGGSQRWEPCVAGVLFALTLLTLMAPGGLYLFPPPWHKVYVAGQGVVWLAVLIFLLSHPNDEGLEALRGQRLRGPAAS